MSISSDFLFLRAAARST